MPLTFYTGLIILERLRVYKNSRFFQKLWTKRTMNILTAYVMVSMRWFLIKLVFVKKNHDGKTIIPTYFEPFVLQNIKTHF